MPTAMKAGSANPKSAATLAIWLEVRWIPLWYKLQRWMPEFSKFKFQWKLID